jgi:hypothetical protein
MRNETLMTVNFHGQHKSEQNFMAFIQTAQCEGPYFTCEVAQNVPNALFCNGTLGRPEKGYLAM